MANKFMSFEISQESPQEELYDVGVILNRFDKDGVPADSQPRELLRSMYSQWFLDLAKPFAFNLAIVVRAMLWNWTPPEIAAALGVDEPLEWER